MKNLRQSEYRSSIANDTPQTSETSLAQTNEDLLVFFLSMFTTVQLEESLAEQRHARQYELAQQAV
ncbi:hypothetical protein LZD49_21025 [Dyadobacter sp. CY261]|uniref:hypothetical protein n=1 Tax=Dyadobacter sp. CY261 TaxID=2907203 RepID=UPI001F320073|nr:hypothetical protein [Dyadobacter sp. CY261]MCF0072976.1 hypothetical protein [Dyadobacter sp. CY261]